MPETYSFADDGSVTYHQHWSSLVPPGWQYRPPLMEHGPEQDDRWCLKHYQDCGWFRLALFRRRCRECEDEEYQAWVEDVWRRLEFGLAAAAHGMTVTWRPSEDTPELIMSRMMELANAPATLTETLAWVRKYLTGDPGEADTADA